MLKEARNKKGMSQSQLAQATGVNIKTIQAYEAVKGRVIDLAKLETLIKFCDALDCRLSDILTDAELIKAVKEYEQGEKI